LKGNTMKTRNKTQTAAAGLAVERSDAKVI
jgi:hypothetical protein